MPGFNDVHRVLNLNASTARRRTTSEAVV